MKKKLILIGLAFAICFGFVFGFNLTQNSINVYSAVSVGDSITSNALLKDESLLATIVDAEDATETFDPYYCLRDDYVIFTQNQREHGLCWTFSSQMAFSTAVMKQTGVYADYSESWISCITEYAEEVKGYDLGSKYNVNVDDYIPGDGGIFPMYEGLAREFGVVLESDFNYDDMYLLSTTSNTDFYNFYSAYADTSIMDNYQAVKFANYSSYSDANKTKEIKKMKNHILKYGSISMSVNWVDLTNGGNYYYKQPNVTDSSLLLGGHAISVIGWNDNVTIGGKKGAWIILNSYGDDYSESVDGTFYLSYYDSNYLNSYFYGYKFVDENADSDTTQLNLSAEITSGGYDYTTNLKGKYYNTFNGTNNVTSQKNIYYSENIDVTFSYDICTGARIDSVKVYYFDEEDLDFSLYLNEVMKTIRVKKFGCKSGTYKVVVDYSMGSDKETLVLPIYVLDGTEFSELWVETDDKDNAPNYNSSIATKAYYGFNSYNFDNDIIEINYLASDLTVSGGKYKLKFVVNVKENVYSNLSANFLGNDIDCEDSYLFSCDMSTALSQRDVVLTIYNSGKTKSREITIRINVLQSSKQPVYVYYNLDGGINSAENAHLEFNNSGFNLSAPTKEDYTFAGWYYDKALTNSLTSSSTGFTYASNKIKTLSSTSNSYYKSQIDYSGSNLRNYYDIFYKGAGVAFVYAKWESNTGIPSDPNDIVVRDSSLTITSEKNSAGEYAKNAQLDFVVDFTHDLKDSFQIESVKLFNSSNVELLSGSSLTFTYAFTTAGTKTVYAKVIATCNGQTVEFTTPNLVFKIASTNNEIWFDSASEIFEWETDFEYDNFTISVYKSSYGESPTLVFTSTDVNSFEFNLSDYVDTFGRYRIQVLIMKDGQTVQTLTSDYIVYYQVTFHSNYADTAPDDLILLEGDEIAPQDCSALAGYNFLGWCLDESLNEDFVLGTTISENITLYAKWELQEITIFDIEEVSTYYEKGNVIDRNVIAGHLSGLNNFEYVWYYSSNPTDGYVVLENNTSDCISFTNVADSGYYYVNVKLTDDFGLSTSINSQPFVVDIKKAQLEIDIDGVSNVFTYTGEEQEINSGAFVYDSNNGWIIDDEEITIVYNIQELNDNKFIDVPLGEYYTLLVYVSETDNYEYAQSEELKIYVNKAQSSLSIDEKAEVQVFIYNGEPVVPRITNISEEQQESISFVDLYTNDEINCENVGEYDVIVKVNESRNYLGDEFNIKIIIKPQTLVVRVHDKVSVLFFKQRKITYSILSGKIHHYLRRTLKLIFPSSPAITFLEIYIKQITWKAQIAMFIQDKNR